MIPTRFILDQVNPLRGVGVNDVLRMIEQGQLGYYARLQWLYYFVEKKDPMVRAVKRRLLAALRGLDWDIKQVDVGENEPDKKAIAEKQAKGLRAAYEKIANLRQGLAFLALAELRGFSHLEKIYRGTESGKQENRNGNSSPLNNSTSQQLNSQPDPWDVVELRIVEQWFWAREGSRSPWTYNPDATETNRGATAINPAQFIIHEIDDPADEIFAEHAIKRKVNDADWDGFLEDYGVPPMFIVGPPNVSPEKEAQYQNVAEKAVSAARGYLPNGSSMESPSMSGSGGTGVFAERLKYIDEQIVIAGTSGQLTVLAESGSGTLAGSAQKEAFDEIAQAIANGIAAVMQAQFDKPLLARLYPDEPVLAYFEMSKVDTQEISDVLDDAGKAATAGFAMDEQELSEKTGMKLHFVGFQKNSNQENRNAGNPNLETTKPGDAAGTAATTVQPAPISKPPSSAAGPDPERINALLAATQQQLAEANAADLAPLRRALETAITDPTPEKLQALLDQLPDLQNQLGETSAEVLRNALGASLATGLTS